MGDLSRASKWDPELLGKASKWDPALLGKDLCTAMGRCVCALDLQELLASQTLLELRVNSRSQAQVDKKKILTFTSLKYH